MKLRKKQRFELKQITEYMISGGAYFWSGYAAFFVLDTILHATFFWAKSVSTLVGWSVNYVLQRYWVFNNPRLAKNQDAVTGRYITVTLVNFVLDFLIVYGLKEAGLTPYIGQFVAAGFFTVWNYVLYKYYVFPDNFKHPTAKPRRVHHAPLVPRRALTPRPRHP